MDRFAVDEIDDLIGSPRVPRRRDPVINGDNRIRTLNGSSICRSGAQDGTEASMSHGGVTCSFVPGIWQSGYLPIVENWRQLSDGKIEFTMRRLPAAD